MKKTITAITATIFFLGTSVIALSANAGSKEKCYGIVKSGQNDCATKTSSCVSSSKIDGQKDAFIVVPKGLCDKLVGGELKSS